MMFEALKRGNHFPWDFQPLRDASEQYTRNHMSVTDRDLQVTLSACAGHRGQTAEVAPSAMAASRRACRPSRVRRNLPSTFTAAMSASG